jgi:DNA-binding transcriptional LysR family regulator
MAINLNQLRAFVGVVDEGSFSAAADALGITQSAVSHTLAAFERSVGQAVVRRADGAEPTSFGERLLPHARAALAAAAAIGDLAAQGAGQPGGTLRLAAPTTVCHGLLPDLLRRWAEEHPRIRVLLFEGKDDDVATWLRAGTVDMAVLVDPVRSTGVEIGQDTFQALLPRDHPLAHESILDVRDLADDPLLFCLGGCEPQVRRVYRSAGLTPIPTHKMRELGTVISMVRAGVGVAIVPGLARAMIDAQLVLVPLRQRVTRRLILTGPADRPHHPAVEALLTSAHSRRG